MCHDNYKAWLGLGQESVVTHDSQPNVYKGNGVFAKNLFSREFPRRSIYSRNKEPIMLKGFPDRGFIMNMIF